MAKEDYLLSKCGRENPFKVPEGYFDQFTDDLMAKLPERTFDEEAPRKVTLWDKVKPVVYLAAMFAGIAAMFAVAEDFMQSGDEADAKTELVATGGSAATTGETAADDAAIDYCNYVMNENEMDDYSMYLYMEEIVE